MSRTLVLMRHGKSDWSVGASDRERPLTARGRQQAEQAGDWLAGQGLGLDLALVSTARRARETWDRVHARLDEAAPAMRLREEAYTFDGEDLVELVRGLDAEGSAMLVGHNPAMEEAVDLLAGAFVVMRTSALAVIELDSWAAAGDGTGRLVAHGRPPLS